MITDLLSIYSLWNEQKKGGGTMFYRIRRIELDNTAEICWRAKRSEIFVTSQDLRTGGIYQLRTGKLYVVESKEN